MSQIDYAVRTPPTGWRKILAIHWPMVLAIVAIFGIGFVMLYSVADGSLTPWALPQARRFLVGLAVMFAVALTPIELWRRFAWWAWGGTLLLLVVVAVAGDVGMGAQRWLQIGPLRLQPSELSKVTLVMALAAYYAWLPPEKVSQPRWLIIPLLAILLPAALIVRQPDLGTALLLVMVGLAVMWLAGVHWGYFLTGMLAAGGAVAAVFLSRGTSWQLLKDYQYRRIDVFLDPDLDPLGAGYHITQSKIAFGSGGLSGRGLMQGTQAQLNFLPEKHTDFIFTTLAEELGFIGSISLLGLYMLVILFAAWSAFSMRDRFPALLTHGLTVNFFLYFAINMAMVMGLAPVVGVPLPLVSYGGSAMLVLMFSFGLIQSAIVHRPR